MKKFSLTNPFIKKGSAAFLLGGLALVSAACGSNKDDAGETAPAASSTISIVAAENFYGEVAEKVGGSYVSVTSLLTSPDADPHDYEPTPDASKAIDQASVVIFNGIGYDEWAQKLIDASGKASDKTVIRVASDVMGHQEGDNEHVWYNPQTMGKYADYLADQLGKLVPEHKKDFMEQAQDYKQSLAPLSDAVASLKQTSPLPVAVSEPVFDYMAQALNLQITDEKFEMAAEEETDPSPQDVAKLQEDIKGKKIKFFVNNIQASSQTVQNLVNLAKENDVPVIEVTETQPAGKSYVEWMTEQLNQIEEVLK
ncbi:zinc ABC transporter solute-binding protein [Paenibacillus lycopersici]|uniref:Zinc ABC transporter solute-binding protein n=1 Tax=Paenibacillus lycopersici TaxID=2704462 RepID=A0A6C0FVC4_9BACL|nr:zinc ABC transporter substrate-binding protein [Paenibacillus lycopersici]QHT61088.1 zinc ABC transporter solute-binding protein [Paenibacillus lycopersici]